jgi:transposase
MNKLHPGRKRARVLVTTTTRSIAEIALEIRAGESTVHRWVKQDGWTRPPGAGRKGSLSPEREMAAQRLYERRGSAADIATLAGVSLGHLNTLVARKHWRPREETRSRERGPAPAPLSGPLAEIEARLRDGTLTRTECARLLDRATALESAEALRTRDPLIQKNADYLARLSKLYDNLPEEPPGAARKDCDCADRDGPATFAEANDLIERILLRIEDACAAEGIAIPADDELAV